MAARPTLRDILSTSSYRAASKYISGQINSIFNRNYKSGLADAVNRQLKTGELVGGKNHLIKGREAITWANRQLRNIYNNEEMTAAEKAKLTEEVTKFRDEVRDAFRSNGQQTK